MFHALKHYPCAIYFVPHLHCLQCILSEMTHCTHTPNCMPCCEQNFDIEFISAPKSIIFSMGWKVFGSFVWISWSFSQTHFFRSIELLFINCHCSAVTNDFFFCLCVTAFNKLLKQANKKNQNVLT